MIGNLLIGKGFFLLDQFIQVCVNPYHYDRVMPPVIGSLDLANLRLDSVPSTEDSNSSPKSVGDQSLKWFIFLSVSTVFSIFIGGYYCH